MVTDFLSWLIKYETHGAEGLLTCFGYPGLHHFFHAINFSIFSIIGKSFLGWYIILSAMHGFNAFLLYMLSRKWNSKFLKGKQSHIPLLAALIFLVYPFHMEAVIWKACLHYLLTSCYLLSSIILWLRYLDTEKWKHVLMIHVLYLMALFTLELSFVFPMVFFFLSLYAWLENKDHSRFWRGIQRLVIPQFLGLAIYFLLTRLAIGEFIGHYGAEKHLVYDPVIILNHGWNYLAKIFLFAHAWSFDMREWLYTDLFSKVYVTASLSLIVICLTILALLKWDKLNASIRSSILFLFVGTFCLAPIINLYFMWINTFENDRYNYLAACFLILFVVYFSASFKTIKYLIPGAFFMISLFLFIKEIRYASQAGTVLHNLLNSFEYEDHQGAIYILSIPENFQGMYMYRDYTDDALVFRESLELFRDIKPKAEIVYLSQFNQMTVLDSIKFDPVEDGIFHVGFRQHGNWFWRHGTGMSDYAKENYSLSLKAGYYRLEMDKIPENTLFLYPEAGIWKAYYPEPYISKGPPAEGE